MNNILVDDLFIHWKTEKMRLWSEKITVTEEICQVQSAAQMHQSSIQTLESAMLKNLEV